MNLFNIYVLASLPKSEETLESAHDFIKTLLKVNIPIDFKMDYINNVSHIHVKLWKNIFLPLSLSDIIFISDRFKNRRTIWSSQLEATCF